jgi:hypothetical protein
VRPPWSDGWELIGRLRDREGAGQRASGGPGPTGDVDVARTYGNMASVEQSLGNFQKALDLYEKALEIFIKVN